MRPTKHSDALRIARGSLVPFPPAYSDWCDVNADGFCNVSDALKIARGQQGSAHEDQLCPVYQGL